MMNITESIKQKTLAMPVTIIGKGLHSGKEVTLTLEPAPADYGIVFQRVDIKNTEGDSPLIPADGFLVKDTLMSSNLIVDNVKVGTVEHLLSAVSAAEIDNLLIKVSDAEIPIMDGSSLEFTKLIEQVGVVNQKNSKQFLQIIKPIRITNEDKWAEFLPRSDDQATEFQLTFEISFDHPAISSTPQKVTFDLSKQGFIDEISPARTFGFMKDLEHLRENGLALGGSLDNAIVLDDTSVINKEGLRFTDEFVRHKILDAVGDLFLIGYSIIGQYNAYKSGHSLNNQLIRAVLSDPTCFKLVTIDEKQATA